MFVPGDVARIKNIIGCTQLELDTWDFLSPTQRDSLSNKIRKFKDLLRHVELFLERRQ